MVQGNKLILLFFSFSPYRKHCLPFVSCISPELAIDALTRADLFRLFNTAWALPGWEAGHNDVRALFFCADAIVCRAARCANIVLFVFRTHVEFSESFEV